MHRNTRTLGMRERRGRDGSTGENYTVGGDGRGDPAALRRGLPYPHRVVASCVAATVEAEPCRVAFMAELRRVAVEDELRRLQPPLLLSSPATVASSFNSG
jgi:hypothetical protein